VFVSVPWLFATCWVAMAGSVANLILPETSVSGGLLATHGPFRSRAGAHTAAPGARRLSRPSLPCYNVRTLEFYSFPLLKHLVGDSSSDLMSSAKSYSALRPGDPKGRQALILVVERNPAVQRLEKYFLEHAGFQVEFANDGKAALERARLLKPRIVVTEILVPKLDGLSLCRAIKSDPQTRHTLVLVFSHLHAEDRAREAEADAFLMKPLDEELLIQTVEKLLASSEKPSGGDS
jgi:CheY-like chemotaxis protein